MPWRRSRLLQNTQSPQITPSLPLGQAPHAVRRPHAEPPPPASIFRFFMRLSFPMRFRDLSTHGPPPHTVSRFPHTTTRLTYFPICHGRSPIARPSPHTIHKLQKSDFHFGEISGSSSTDPQPTPSSKHPGPALPSSKPSANRFKQITWLQSTQNKHRPVPANHTCLRLGGAVTSCARIPARTAMAMRASSRPCSYLYGLCARPRQRPGTLLTRPASGLSRSTRPTRLLKCPAAASHLRRSTIQPALKSPGGHGHGVAWRCDDGGGPASKPARRPAPAAQGVDPRGIWTGWTRQKSADAAPDRAGRMTDHAGQARRHACATPLGYCTFIFSSISLEPSRNMVFVSFWPSINTSSLSFVLSSLRCVPQSSITSNIFIIHPLCHLPCA